MLRKNFLWSASTSAYQVEGASQEYGKGLSVQDVKTPFPGTPDFKICSDHYHRYKEDIALFKEMGLKAYRFSIAWTRILPNGVGKINKEGLEFYSNLIDELLKNEIEPIVTIYHFDLPYELEKKGGWYNKDVIDAFVNYSKILFENYGDRVKYWLTINEQNMMIIHGDKIMGSEVNKKLYQGNHNMLLAQARVISLCHEILPNALIGPAPSIALVYPETCKPEDILASIYANVMRNWLYLDVAIYGRYNHMALKIIKDKGFELEIEKDDLEILKNAKPDFIAFNYYQTSTVSNQYSDSEKLEAKFSEKGYFESVINDNLKFTEFGWQIDPIGFENTLNEIYSRYHLPILITENGLGAYDKLEDDKTIHDYYRIEYLKEHIKAMKNAANTGVDIIGYSPWSAIDLISTHQGFEKRYGFIYVNRNNESVLDLKRYKKDSFYWYRDVINSNGEKI